MSKTLTDVIFAVEAEFPELHWLLRSGEESEPGSFFAHIFDPNSEMTRDGYSVSYFSWASTVDAALWAALEKARAGSSMAVEYT